MARIKFEEASQEAFEAFADEVAEEADFMSMTYHDAPIMGAPYILINMGKGMSAYPLIVEAGDELVTADSAVWIERKNSGW
jgi:hypothetical protein